MTIGHDSDDHQSVDEQTPLIAVKRLDGRPTPLPLAQLSILLFLQLAEPLTSQVIYPFAPQLIRDIGIAGGDEKKVGYYVGILHSAFFAAQAATILHWSRLSDYIGRKPVLMSGLFGISMTMYSFGLQRTYWGLVISRSLCGALNGNIGVMKSMIAEFTDSTNVAQAFSYMPLSWSTGSTVGPLIGGALSKPHERFPKLFGNSVFMKTYPYFLACSIPATFSLLTIAITYIYLKETVSNPVTFRSLFIRKVERDEVNEAEANDPNKPAESSDDGKRLPLRALLTSRVIVATLSYALVSLSDIAFRGVQPLFLSTPLEYGGLGFDPPTIGAFLSVMGVFNGLMQVLAFPIAHRYFGARRLYLMSTATVLPAISLFPTLTFLARQYGTHHWLVFGAILLQLGLYVFSCMAYSCIFIYIAAASPNRHSIGATNGIAQMVVSIMRTVGPSFANSLYSLTIEQNYLGGWLVWYALCVVALSANAAGLLLPHAVWKREGELN